MSGPSWKVVWTISFAICAVLRGSAQTGAATCDPRTLDADSYALATRAVAEVVLEERTSWWDSFSIGRHGAALDDLNSSATSVAEYALRLDDVSSDYRDPWNPNVRTIGMGPFDFNQRIRYTIAKHVDPEARIKLPKASRSAGW